MFKRNDRNNRDSMDNRDNRSNRNNNRYDSAPVNVGEEYDVKIEDTGKSGDGIAKVEGYILFVPNAKKGQEVKIKVTETKRNLGFAELVE
ncbi:23S rRNA (uracil-C(5))-methyltransferase RlmCD [Methanobrevibacter curvatus]|uniref:23S rRNA (Uracil-C(5))-methyltransferase RlmCD n=2 Tax=Methanobrevibacter curvatus TaxID=49547 RepID=A0A165ZDH7_9EURY|nr:23S rRNA (uracil-C(5))-methyltransferase RlmCD [Methanobrevibacter curvatus]